MVTPSEQQNWPISARPMRGSWNRREKCFSSVRTSGHKQYFVALSFELKLLKWFHNFLSLSACARSEKTPGQVGRQTNIDSHLNSNLAKTIGPL